ncbi:aromatic amino acid hydroxylase [Neobacillus ginsengisoli]|uniref:Phenylalanine-4-hydroxylase n=1 Tax=Neobacillus ginsengisoli TaxID=904295 RepID=A0ABT9Y0V6_9BACI|nr:aromatic amino acid hydroxylase [Neobacillus ginsengisoli]MDQ0200787.1 phenylalanine-4-hydroxylase [Neobacillus ginsengisoli]
MNQLVKQIPAHLRQFVSEQHYETYTPIDHAVWRYVMRQNHHALKDTAHPAYVEGLLASGIDTEAIPNVADMNERLAKIGWGAAIVDGLIPGVAFFDFQAHGILPIAVDIRKVENIEYTPAPDIIHEAAGHAPIIFDAKYASYVKQFGEIGAKAFATKAEHEVFEAVRQLTIVMEDRHSTPEQIEEAKQCLSEKQKAVTGKSEAEEISRIFWWTVEYGLIGTLENPQIYGAGLLSSVGESKHCLSENVAKLPFSVESCIQTSYDVTTMQPQLFVCESFDQLIEAIEKFANTMAFRKGGTESLEKALQSGSTSTIVLNSGLQMTGTLEKIVKDSHGDAIYVKTTGPTALAIDDKELPGHSKAIHRDGFGTPIGLLEGDIALEECTEEQLLTLGIEKGRKATLTFKSGIQVTGVVSAMIRNANKLTLISFESCNVTLGDHVLFEEQWGTFDMAVGSSVTSAFPGAADAESFFGIVEMPKKGPTEPRSVTELENMYQTIRELREKETWDENSIAVVQAVLQGLRSDYPKEWLLRLEILELFCMHNVKMIEKEQVQQELVRLSETKELQRLVENGLALLQ